MKKLGEELEEKLSYPDGVIDNPPFLTEKPENFEPNTNLEYNDIVKYFKESHSGELADMAVGQVIIIKNNPRSGY